MVLWLSSLTPSDSNSSVMIQARSFCLEQLMEPESAGILEDLSAEELPDSIPMSGSPVRCINMLTHHPVIGELPDTGVGKVPSLTDPSRHFQARTKPLYVLGIFTWQSSGLASR